MITNQCEGNKNKATIPYFISVHNLGQISFDQISTISLLDNGIVELYDLKENSVLKLVKLFLLGKSQR